MPEVTKRKVTVTNVVALGVDEHGHGQVLTRMDQAFDYVRPDFLDTYVVDAKAVAAHQHLVRALDGYQRRQRRLAGVDGQPSRRQPQPAADHDLLCAHNMLILSGE